VTSEPDVSGADASRRRLPVVLAVSAFVLGADLLSKILVVSRLGNEPKRLLGGAVYLVQARNSGAAFSLGTGMTIVLTAVAVSVVVAIVRMAARLTSVWWAIALGSILGGALGNLVDRFFRAPSPGRGHVVDWISLFAADGHVWPIFNLADAGIVSGAVLAVVLTMKNIHYDDSQIAKTVTEANGDDG
jgi:signal peptidase II